MIWRLFGLVLIYLRVVVRGYLWLVKVVSGGVGWGFFLFIG